MEKLAMRVFSVSFEVKEIRIPEGYLRYRDGSGDENIAILSIFIEPNKRKKGKGRKIVEELEKIAKERKLACIYCFTRKSNKEAQRFYEAIGFEKICDISGFYRSEDGIMYLKKL